MQFMSFLILLFAFVIGYATFIENDFGRSTAKALIFNTWWFELILILLAFNLVNNVIKLRWRANKKFAAFAKLTPESEIYDGYQVYYIAKDKTYEIHRLGGMVE